MIIDISKKSDKDYKSFPQKNAEKKFDVRFCSILIPQLQSIWDKGDPKVTER